MLSLPVPQQLCLLYYIHTSGLQSLQCKLKLLLVDVQYVVLCILWRAHTVTLFNSYCLSQHILKQHFPKRMKLIKMCYIT